MGLKWLGCSVHIRLWPRLPLGVHRLLSIVPMFGASAVRFVSSGSSLAPLLLLALLGLWALLGCACIPVRGHSIPVLRLVVPFYKGWGWGG